MVRPSPSLAARLRLTTKQVNGGYYKGNRSGSMGAHTQWGGYVIDYRKTRNYNCPMVGISKLTPFVSPAVEPTETTPMGHGLATDMAQLRNGKALIEAYEELDDEQYNDTKAQWKEYLIATQNKALEKKLARERYSQPAGNTMPPTGTEATLPTLKSATPSSRRRKTPASDG